MLGPRGWSLCGGALDYVILILLLGLKASCWAGLSDIPKVVSVAAGAKEVAANRRGNLLILLETEISRAQIWQPWRMHGYRLNPLFAG